MCLKLYVIRAEYTKLHLPVCPLAHALGHQRQQDMGFSNCRLVHPCICAVNLLGLFQLQAPDLSRLQRIQDLTLEEGMAGLVKYGFKAVFKAAERV